MSKIRQKHTEETKKKISEALKGNKNNIGGKGFLGHKHSEETKKKMSLAKKGKPLSEERKRNLIKAHSEAHKGKPFSEEHKKRLSEAHRGKPLSEEHRKKISMALKGENSPGWKGGVAFENHRIRCGIEFRLWREAVFARDNWTCQKCGKRGGKLHPHHIKNFAEYPELRFAIDNGITLCVKCHKTFHSKYIGDDF